MLRVGILLIVVYRRLEFKPEKCVRREGDGVGLLGDRGEVYIAKHLHRHHALELAQIQRNGLCKAGKVRHAEHLFIAIAANIGDYLVIRRREKLLRSAAKHLEQLTQRDHVADPVQQRGLVAQL